MKCIYSGSYAFNKLYESSYSPNDIDIYTYNPTFVRNVSKIDITLCDPIFIDIVGFLYPNLCINCNSTLSYSHNSLILFEIKNYLQSIINNCLTSSYKYQVRLILYLTFFSALHLRTSLLLTFDFVNMILSPRYINLYFKPRNSLKVNKILTSGNILEANLIKKRLLS